MAASVLLDTCAVATAFLLRPVEEELGGGAIEVVGVVLAGWIK